VTGADARGQGWQQIAYRGSSADKQGLTTMATPRAGITIVLNCFEELKELVPVP